MAQFFSGIESIYQFYLKCPNSGKENIPTKPFLMRLSPSIVCDISKHLESYLSQIIATNRRSKYLVELPPLDLSYFWPYDNLIFKWFNTSKNQLLKKRKI